MAIDRDARIQFRVRSSRIIVIIFITFEFEFGNKIVPIVFETTEFEG